MLILASGSPRRSDLLKKHNIDFKVIVPDADEHAEITYTPEDAAKSAAMQKAKAVLNRAGDGDYILAADTIVTYGGEIFEKPVDFADAKRILSSLSGNTHSVITGIAIIKKGTPNIVVNECVTTRVTFYPLTEKQIEDYIATGEPMDKSGAYAVQGISKVFVKSVEGDIENVVGLPTRRVIEILKQTGYQS